MSEHEIVWQCAHCGAKGWGFRVSGDWVLRPDGWLTDAESGSVVCSLECARYMDMSDEEAMGRRSLADDQNPNHHFSPEQLAIYRDRFGWDRTPRAGAGGRLCQNCALQPGQCVRIWPSRKRDLGEPTMGLVKERDGRMWIDVSHAGGPHRALLPVESSLVVDRLVAVGQWEPIQ